MLGNTVLSAGDWENKNETHFFPFRKSQPSAGGRHVNESFQYRVINLIIGKCFPKCVPLNTV